jgi:dihydroneopterin aldolase
MENYFGKKPPKLSIFDLRIWVHLGCSEQEKFHPQLVSFDIDLIFKTIPNAVITDKLEETICYLGIAEKVKSLCKNKYFNLIEHLSYNIYKVINESLNENRLFIELINVTTKKISPPVPGINGGVSFSYSNSPSSDK